MLATGSWDGGMVGGMATLGVKRDPKMSSLIYPQDLFFFGISWYIPLYSDVCWLYPHLNNSWLLIGSRHPVLVVPGG